MPVVILMPLPFVFQQSFLTLLILPLAADRLQHLPVIYVFHVWLLQIQPTNQIFQVVNITQIRQQI